MNHLSFTRNESPARAHLSHPSHGVFPQRSLYTVPEQDAESWDSHSIQYSSSTLAGPENDPERHWPNTKDLTHSHTPSQAHGLPSWLVHLMQKPEDPPSRRQAHRWTTSLHLILHLFNFAASIAIVALVGHALISHGTSRHIRQFGGADNAWPKSMSLQASIILLSAASTNVVKSAAFFAAEVRNKIRTYNKKDMFLIITAACSTTMAAIWVAASVFVEINRQRHDNFATWACARSDATLNQVVPYRAICNEEVCEIICRVAFANC